MNLIAQPVANTREPGEREQRRSGGGQQQADGDQHHRQHQADGKEPAAAGREDFERAGRRAVASSASK